MRRWVSLAGTALFTVLTVSACGVTLLGEEASDPPPSAANLDGSTDTASSSTSSTSSSSGSSGASSGASSTSSSGSSTSGGADTGTDAITDSAADVKDSAVPPVPCLPANCASKSCSNNACDPVVFVTDAVFSGALGGVDGADQKCLAAFTNSIDPTAKAGRVRAWIGAPTMPPGARFEQSTRPYRLRSGTIVANNWTQLVSVNLGHAIDMDENGMNVGDVQVWTGLDQNGAVSGDHCTGWTLPGANVLGNYGRTNASTRPLWTLDGSDSCATSKHLYCFEQLP